jgi:hypothetical protein
MYVSDGGAGLFEYPINPDGTLGAPLALSLPGTGNPFPPNVITFGPDNGLYSVGHYANKIFFYQQGPSGSWNFTYYLEPIYHSNSVVIDGKAYVYASGYIGSGTQVQVYPPGAKGHFPPTVVIPGDGSYCCNVAVWAEQLYVSGTGIRVFSTPYSNPVLKRTITGATHFGGPVTLDKASELYVGNGLNVLAYSPFANGNVKPDRVIFSQTSPKLSYEVSMAVIGQTLYVFGFANGAGSTIWIFDSQVGRQNPKQVVSGIGTNPLSMAIGPLSVPAPTPSPVPSPTPTPFPTPKEALFVSQFESNSVTLYSPFVQPKLLATITDGIVYPGGLWVDRAGTLYVANEGTGTMGGTVTEYPPGKVSPSLTLSNGLYNPVAVAVDRFGAVFVSNLQCCVVVFPPGQTTPSASIGFQLPWGVTVDGAGNLFVADFYVGVWEIPHGSTTPQLLNLQGLPHGSSSGVIGLAIDRHGDLYVADSTGTTHVYAPGRTQAFWLLATGTPGFPAVTRSDIFFNADGNNRVRAWQFKASGPFETITDGMNLPMGSAVRPAVRP